MLLVESMTNTNTLLYYNIRSRTMAFRYWCCLDPVALVHNSRDSIQASLNKTCVRELTLSLI